MTSARIPWVLVLALALGCAGRAAGGGETSETSESETDTDSPEDSEESEESEESEDTEDTPPDLWLPEACEPGGDASVEIQLLGIVWEEFETDLDITCTFTGVSVDGKFRVHELEACTLVNAAPGPAHISLRIAVDPELLPSIDPGTVVRLRYHSWGYWDHSFALTAQPDDRLLLAGKHGEGLGLDLDPFEIHSADRDCGSIPDSCATAFEQRLEVGLGDEQVEVIAGQSVEIGDPDVYRITVGTARRYEAYRGCHDVSRSWYEYLIALVPDR